MINTISYIFKVFPRWMLIFFYDAIKPFSGKIYYGFRYILVKNLCKNIGNKVIIGCNVTFKHWQNISIGNLVSIHENSYLDGYGSIEIGNNVSIAHNCSFISSSHTWENISLSIRENPIEKRPVYLADNIWIGCGVRIIGRVTIEKDIIVGANSLVLKDLKQNGIYVGSPAIFVKNVYPIVED